MIGIRFNADICYGQYLHAILKYVLSNNYDWYVIQSEVLYYCPETQQVRSDLFSNLKMSNEQFMRIITNNEYCIYTLNLCAYPSDKCFSEIVTYADFKNSDCEIVLLCCDCEFFDVYCKNKEIIKDIYRAVIESDFKNIEFISEKNDKRLMLRV